jgi:hypothetical protein
MIQEKTESLMWEKIDGTISPADEAQLEAVLGKDAEAREHWEELARFSELLGGVEELEPPTALRQRIEGAIDLDRYAARRPAAPSFFNRLFPLRMDLRIAAAAVAGLVVGIVGYHLVTLETGPKGSLDNVVTGTIGRVHNGLEIDLEGIRGAVSFRQDNTLAISEVDITTQREVELYLECEGRSVQFRATGDVDSPLHDISLAGNTIVVKNLGAAEYVATFYREDGVVTPLRVRIVSGGELLLEEEVQPSRLR